MWCQKASMSTWYKYLNQLQHRSIQNCFVIGWNICIRSEILSYWLSNKLSYKSTIERKIEVLDFRRPQIMAPERQFSDRCVGPPGGGLELNPYLKKKHVSMGHPVPLHFLLQLLLKLNVLTYIMYLPSSAFLIAHTYTTTKRGRSIKKRNFTMASSLLSPPLCLLVCLTAPIQGS